MMKITADFHEFTGNGGAGKKVATLLFNPCFHSVCLFRLSNWFYRKHLSVVAKIIWYINRLLFHVDIDYRADLAEGFCLVHGLGVVIGKNVKSLGPLTVYQGVTLGGTGKVRELPGGEIIDQPLLGRNTVIFTNSCIFGPVVTPDNYILKAGRMLTKDPE